jgi:phosphomannomutase
VAEATKIGDKIYAFTQRTGNENLKNLLLKIYDKKQIRFGTSGFRAYVSKDFTQRRSDIISLATAREVNIFQKKGGRTIVIVYDTRLGSREYAIESARVLMAQGFPVKVSREAAPTGALVYWLIEEEKLQAAAGENMTPSHNPISMQGQRLSLYNGDVAPTSVTDRVEREANLINLNDDPIEKQDLCKSEHEGKFQFIDIRDRYTTWIADLLKEQKVAIFDKNGKITGRRPLPELLREFYSKKSFIHNAMNGAARGYISEIFRKMGIYEESVFQMDSEKDSFLKLRHYGNPEERWMVPTTGRMKALDAMFEGATDPDGDRCGGVLDESGFTNLNKLMAMLIEFVVVDLDWKGHQIIRTGSTSTSLDDVILKLTSQGYDIKTPEAKIVNSLVRHPFYNLIYISDKSVADLQKFPCVVTEVGFKYISAAMKKYDLPAAVAGEESGGFSIKRFPDKDGIVGLCLVASMVAQRNKKPGELWRAHRKKYGNTFDKRVDLWVPNYPKEKLINYLIDNPPMKLGGQTIKWLGGTKNDKVELVMEEKGIISRIVIRASGTEDMNRLYMESKNEKALDAIEKETLEYLKRFVLEDLEQSHNYFELAEKIGAFGTSYLDEAGKKVYFAAISKKIKELASKYKVPPIEIYRKVLNLLTYGMDRDINVRHVAWGNNIGEEFYQYMGGVEVKF